MKAGPRVLLALGVILAGAWEAQAELVRLKNGGTIACDSITERGPDLVLHVGKMTIVVPKDEVDRIDKTPPATGSAAAPPGPPSGGAAPKDKPGAQATAPKAPPATGAADDPAADAARLDDLRRRLAGPAMGRDENRRQIVALLDRMGERSLQNRQPEEARRRFEEALAWEPADLRARRGQSASLLMLDRTAEARTTLERALLDAPGDADLNYLLGEALEKQGRTDEALATLDKAYAARPTPALRDRIDTLRRQHGVDGGYRSAEASRFVLSYDGAHTSPELEAEILAYLEGQFPELAIEYDYTPPESIAVVLYPEKGFYDATQTGPDVAGLYDGKVRVPIGGLKRLDPQARAVLRHELAHAFITGKSRGAAPRWLQEGLAQWAEGKRPTAGGETGLARAYREAPDRWPGAFSYDSALSFTAYLMQQHGASALNDVLAAMGRGSTAEQALQDVLRVSLPDLKTAWGDELGRRYLQ
ncbi:MAG TPA: tetratricopeptide repeat protein [Candidatus Polarisedimenticolia bacterium]|nr:tetratricopeptide repeat protein [Candidatus Polarisedimenticolia bacterium]